MKMLSHCHRETRLRLHVIDNKSRAVVLEIEHEFLLRIVECYAHIINVSLAKIQLFLQLRKYIAQKTYYFMQYNV